jgi:hypothetical protein
MTTEPRRRALVIAVDEYCDSRLRGLRAPGVDAEELARVLGSQAIGQFDVEVLRNHKEGSIRRRLAKLLAEALLDDLLLLHFSCHGLKGDDGELYFAANDTEIDNLEATGISADWVNRQIGKSRSRQIILLLDCCYSGAFLRGSFAKAGDGVELKERFDGRGRVILTASNSMEYAFEGDVVSGRAAPSNFTSAIVEGLETGLADRDADSLVSVDELYDFVFDRVRELTPNQTPSKWAFGVEGEVYIARNPVPQPVKPAELPRELMEALDSPVVFVREGAVRELGHLLESEDEPMQVADRQRLHELLDEDSRRISGVAAELLERFEQEHGSPIDATPTSEPASATLGRPALSETDHDALEELGGDDGREAPEAAGKVDQPLAPDDAWVDPDTKAGSPELVPPLPNERIPTLVWSIGAGAAALFAVGLLYPWDKSGQDGKVHSWADRQFSDTGWITDVLTALSPLMLAVGTLAALALAYRFRARRVFLAGLLIGLGIAGIGKYGGLVLRMTRFNESERRLDSLIVFLIVVAGACTLVAIGTRMVLHAPADRLESTLRRRLADSLAIAGVVLVVLGCRLDFNGAAGRAVVLDEGWLALDPLVAALAGLGALLIARHNRWVGGGVLLAVGVVSIALWTRYIGVPIDQGSGKGSWGYGGFVGLAGSLLFVAAGSVLVWPHEPDAVLSARSSGAR